MLLAMNESCNIYNTFLYNDAKVNILWFSDIHYLEKEKQPKDKFFKSFKSSFIKKCNEINSNEIIDYVIISGDLAQSGEKNEYVTFFDDILKPLFNKLKDAKLLIIPGNHDLTYDYLDKNLYLTKKNKEYLKIIKKEELFKNYTDFFSKKINLFSDKMSLGYLNTFYNGYLIDREKKVIFVLLNSAWLSYSNEILKYYLKNKVSNNDLKDDSKILKHAIEIYSKTLEQGEQLLALEETFSNYSTLNEFIKNHPDYIVINIKHHPENWLKWEERLSLNEDSFLKLLNDNSHIFLDSHEHVRKEWKPYQNKNHQLFLKSGAFIELKYVTETINKNGSDVDVVKEAILENNLENSLFHTISINSSRKTINFKNFSYSNTTKWNEFNNNSNLNFELQKKIIPPLDSNYRQSIIDKIKEKIKVSSFKLISEIFLEIKLIPSKEDDNFAINGKDLFVFQKNNMFDFFKYDFIISNEIKNIYFVCIDLLIDNNVYDNELCKFDRDFALGNLRSDLEAKFNRFRTNFFNSNEFKDNHILSIEFEALTLNLVLLPYWEIHNI